MPQMDAGKCAWSRITSSCADLPAAHVTSLICLSGEGEWLTVVMTDVQSSGIANRYTQATGSRQVLPNASGATVPICAQVQDRPKSNLLRARPNFDFALPLWLYHR